MNHLDAHGLITNWQHAFYKGRCCTTQLCTVINDWSKSIDQGLQTDVFILDFAKAFDSVPHKHLKVKLFRYGINGKTLEWIDKFLCHRYQWVAVNGSKSDWSPVVSGVPQGTVLGPVLFNIFINDIVDTVDSETRLFADDCVCYRPIEKDQDYVQLQRDIDHLTSWAKEWYMRFEPSKCKIMHITRKTTHKITHQYIMEHTSLESVHHTKYLSFEIRTSWFFIYDGVLFDTANHINLHFLQYQWYYKLNTQLYAFKTTILGQYWKLMNNEKGKIPSPIFWKWLTLNKKSIFIGLTKM